jgi:isochorismate synthase
LKDLEQIIQQNNKYLGISFVAYRRPFEENITIYKGKTTHKIEGEGFVFSPFFSELQTDSPLIFFPRLSCEKSVYTSFHPFAASFADIELAYFLEPSQYSTRTFEDYRRNFEAAFAYLQEKTLHKIVLSHREKQALPKNILAFFAQLLQNFSSAFVYLLYSPASGMWMGASPELLFEKKDKLLKTIALAATQAQNNFQPWNPKETKEQALVADFIRAVLEKHTLKMTQQDGPYTAKYGDMLHLKTDFTAEISPHFSEADFISDLHPTPAVAGLPQKQAMAFLQEREQHRAYYTGYLGEISPEYSQLFVNLRCASVWADGLYVYAGGGVTPESTLDKEWAEIQMKLLNLKRFL